MAELRKTTNQLRSSNEEQSSEVIRAGEQLQLALAQLGLHGRTRGKGSPLSEDLKALLDWASGMERERQSVVARLFGGDGSGHSTADVLAKLDEMYEERGSLLLELEEMQQSSSKLAEDHIFDLKQSNEDLHIEIDRLTAQNKSLSRELAAYK